MPEDLLTRYLGHTCPKCNAEEREPNQKWCSSCLTASQRWWADYTAQTAAEEMGYGPAAPRQPDPAPPPVFQPRGLCPRCGASQWVDRSEGQWGCAGCGWDPVRPGQAKPI
jgi:hypothetical protein